MTAMDQLDELHRRKAKLSLEVTATINLAQSAIARSLTLSREIKKLIGDRNTEQQDYGNGKGKIQSGIQPTKRHR